MAGTAEVLKQLDKRQGITYTCLAPNEKALEIYWDTHSDEKCDELIIFAATSESFNKVCCLGTPDRTRVKQLAGESE